MNPARWFKLASQRIRTLARGICNVFWDRARSARQAAAEEYALISDGWALEHSGQVIYNVHDVDRCYPSPCPIHNRSHHHMRSYPQNFRGDRGFTERICPHGIGHPDPDDPFADPIHGCDGCCSPTTGDQ